MRLQSRLLAALSLALPIALIGQGPVRAQLAQQDTQDQIQQEIQQLRQRLDQLERRQNQLQQQQTQPPPAAQPQQPQVQPLAPPAAAAPPPSATAASETVERALERSLIEQGGLLLPAYKLDLVPIVQYSHMSTTDQLGIVTSGPSTVIAPLTTRQDILEADVTARYGLPFASQINLTLPFVTNWERTANLSSNTTTSHTNSGLGDIDIGLSKQLLYEHQWVPDAIAEVSWKTTTGTAQFNPAINQIQAVAGTGTGFDQATASLTLVKRQDPLVFLGGASYSYVFNNTTGGNNFEPGDQIEWRLGTILAASPDTALRFLFDSTFIDKSKFNGVTLAGSDRVLSTLEIGGSSVISASTLIDAAVDIGLTRDTPDFRFILQVPIHF